METQTTLFIFDSYNDLLFRSCSSEYLIGENDDEATTSNLFSPLLLSHRILKSTLGSGYSFIQNSVSSSSSSSESPRHYFLEESLGCIFIAVSSGPLHASRKFLKYSVSYALKALGPNLSLLKSSAEHRKLYRELINILKGYSHIPSWIFELKETFPSFSLETQLREVLSKEIKIVYGSLIVPLEILLLVKDSSNSRSYYISTSERSFSDSLYLQSLSELSSSSQNSLFCLTSLLDDPSGHRRFLPSGIYISPINSFLTLICIFPFRDKSLLTLCLLTQISLLTSSTSEYNNNKETDEKNENDSKETNGLLSLSFKRLLKVLQGTNKADYVSQYKLLLSSAFSSKSHFLSLLHQLFSSLILESGNLNEELKSVSRVIESLKRELRSWSDFLCGSLLSSLRVECLENIFAKKFLLSFSPSLLTWIFVDGKKKRIFVSGAEGVSELDSFLAEARRTFLTSGQLTIRFEGGASSRKLLYHLWFEEYDRALKLAQLGKWTSEKGWKKGDEMFTTDFHTRLKSKMNAEQKKSLYIYEIFAIGE